MVILGLILLVVIAVVVIAVLVGGTEAVRFDALGLNLDTTSAGVFLIGVVSGILGLLALYLLLSGTRRSASRRREVRGLRQEAAVSGQAQAERDRLAAERDELAERQAELDQAPDPRPFRGQRGDSSDGL